jgi:hypothetical protein
VSDESTAIRAAEHGPSLYAGLMQFALDEPRREIRKFVAKRTDALVGDMAEEFCEQLRLAYIAGVADGYRESKREPDCELCKGLRVMVHAGDLDRDDGYCELRTCSLCSDDRRLGRSDQPIVSEVPA